MDWSDLKRPLKGKEKILSKKGMTKGQYSTQRTRTVQNPDGSYMNVNTLWKTKQGSISDTGHMSDDWIASHARYMEKQTGLYYPRFKDVKSAVEAASKRSKKGGASSNTPFRVPKPKRKPKGK